MKAATFLLTLGFAGLQTFSWIDCCCGYQCLRPNDVCPDHAHGRPGPEKQDCCKEKDRKAPAPHAEACLHLFPQSAVEPLDVSPPPPPIPLAAPSPPYDAGVTPPAPLPEITPSPPRLRSHLLLGVLLI